MMKAVVELGGKQYLVEPGIIFLAEKVDTPKGDKYTTDKVLCILDGDDVVLGRPFVGDAKVTFSVLDQTKLKKVISQKFRSKKGILKTMGHRQYATQLQVDIIECAGKKAEYDSKPKAKTLKKTADNTVNTDETADETSKD